MSTLQKHLISKRLAALEGKLTYFEDTLKGLILTIVRKEMENAHKNIWEKVKELEGKIDRMMAGELNDFQQVSEPTLDMNEPETLAKRIKDLTGRIEEVEPRVDNGDERMDDLEAQVNIVYGLVNILKPVVEESEYRIEALDKLVDNLDKKHRKKPKCE